MTENQPDHALPHLDRPKPLRDRVYEIMRHQILSGQFQPGQHLAEEQLAEQFGVSRTPVREAFQRLKIEGLVVESGNGRLRVQHLTKESISQALELRRVLETYACQRAADNIGEEQLDQLRQLERSESEALAKEDLERISEINSAIHELILESSGNDVLMDLIGYLQARVPSYRLFALGNEENLQAFSRSHGRIISLLEQGEGSKAGEEMSRHVKLAKDVMLQALEERQTN